MKMIAFYFNDEMQTIIENKLEANIMINKSYLVLIQYIVAYLLVALLIKQLYSFKKKYHNRIKVQRNKEAISNLYC